MTVILNYTERVLNLEPVPLPLLAAADLTVLVLDDPISPAEVDFQIRKIKVDIACGPDGLPPGVLAMLPPAWLLPLTTLFNTVLTSGAYPASWTRAKLLTVFKRGNRSDLNNYRGISVTNNMTKIYDVVLCHRLCLWFRLYREQAGAQSQRGWYREQAGAQSQRGCIEHLVTLRFTTDTACRKKFELFATFIDFNKAYDLVPRLNLSVLERLGCVILC